MKIIVDDKIPYIRGLIEKIADKVIYLPGGRIGKADVADADILIIRTRTICNRQLLEGSKVRFIVTATIGYDHIDIVYCKEAGIRWTNCPGCNANSVCQYVHNALLATGWMKKGLTVGIVGVGHVGTLVARDLQSCGMKLLLCDPPRQDAHDFIEGYSFTSLAAIQSEADIITFHTPLIKEGVYSTYHMVDRPFLEQLQKNPLIINASRGSVVDNDALLWALHYNVIADAVVDTWEYEPQINLELLNAVKIGTPHVAGYSADGKANATKMAVEAVANYLSIPYHPTINLPNGPVLSMESILEDSYMLKQNPDKFEQLRGNYPIRRESITKTYKK